MVASDHDTLSGIMQRRRSVRRYSREIISKELLDELLKAAQLAPSAGNLQARDFIVVRDPNKKHELALAAYGQFFVAMAPVSYTHLRAHETRHDLVCRLLLE